MRYGEGEADTDMGEAEKKYGRNFTSLLLGIDIEVYI